VRWSFAALLAVSAVLPACARNAALEIELTVPARPAMGPELYAVAIFMTGDFDFDSVAIDPAYSGTALTSAPQQLRYSVLSERPDGRVRMVMFFCETPSCRGEDPSTLPQSWYEFERASYVGERTRWAGAIPVLPTGRPTAAVCVDRCEVEGCIGGDGSFCRMDGTHYCQAPGEDPGEEVCEP